MSNPDKETLHKQDIVDKLLKQAIEETENLEIGEEILLRDLFKGYEWKKHPVSIRLRLGTLFLSYVEKTNSKLEATTKTSSNQQKYKKKK